MSLEQISILECVTGYPMQRLTTYFMEGLATQMTRLSNALSSFHGGFSVCLAGVFHSISLSKIFFQHNSSDDSESMKKEKVLHIIDLDTSEALQWIPLL